MGKHAIRFGAAAMGLCLFFGTPKVAFSQQRVQLADIKIPSAAGYVIETHDVPATAPAHPAVLIHIQEAHTNYEAQQHIVQILDELVRAYQLKLILVEGSSGDVGLSHLRSYSPVTHRKRVAEKYLKAGLISGEEFLDLVSEYPLTLWGVEDDALYKENVQTFLGSESLQASVKAELAQAREAVRVLRPALLDPDLNTLDEQRAAFDRQDATLAEYTGTLERLAQQHALDLAPFPTLVQFLAIRAQEQQLRPAKVQRDQRMALAALSAALPADAFDPLMTQAKAMSAGTLTALEFYRALKQAAADARLDLTAYPALADYTTYLEASAAISTSALDRELAACAAALQDRLTRTPESQDLHALIDALDLAAKLAEFTLSPEEYTRFTALTLEEAWPRWHAFLTAQRGATGQSAQSLDAFGRLLEPLMTLKRFYEVAHERDEVMVRNAVAKLDQSGEPLAVLITGGFHSPRITAMLKAQGIATVMLIPKASQPTNDRLYRAVVRYKSGQGGSFEEVMSLANQAAPQRTTAEAVRP